MNKWLWVLLALFSMSGCARGQDAPRPIRLTEMPQTPLDIPAGQYSGISFVHGNQFVVVDDKVRGGGIQSFVMKLDSLGYLDAVLATNLRVNDSGEKGLDNEDIVYASGRHTLFVASEGTQTIREYNLSGKPTGASLAIPEEFGVPNITPNRGFEALAYNETTGLFWTTTEVPLIADSLYRFQSFSAETLEPMEQFLYAAEPPVVEQSSIASARAYVFGIPAITALDDGRLLVMEREVFVPQGGLGTLLTDSFTATAIYEVDPVRCKAPVLEKKKLLSFRTGALNLANFEGMCLGPVLPDGTQTLLLIADSQNGAYGLVGEYIKVIKLQYE
jgi:hypothetical protein